MAPTAAPTGVRTPGEGGFETVRCCCWSSEEWESRRGSLLPRRAPGLPLPLLALLPPAALAVNGEDIRLVASRAASRASAAARAAAAGGTRRRCGPVADVGVRIGEEVGVGDNADAKVAGAGAGGERTECCREDVAAAGSATEARTGVLGGAE